MKRHKRHTIKSNGRVAILRAVGLVAAIVVVVSGVTFAALQSQQVKLTGNTIQTASANLQISQDGTTFTSALTGYSFNNLIPGGAAMPASGVYFALKNSGGASLGLKFAVSSTPTNLNDVDLTKVNVILTPLGGSPQTFTLAALIAANSTGGLAVLVPSQLAAGSLYQYTLQVSMASDAITGSSASIGNVDFAFTGVAQ